jgi:enterobactin synthetase component D
MTQLPPTLLPPDVARHCLWFDAHRGAALADFAAGVELPAQLRGAVDSRKREFIAGRRCAREAIGALTPELARVPVLIGPGRDPLWPEGLVGSLSHSHGIAIAAVARAADYCAIGIDSERLMPQSTATDIAAQIASATELEALARTMSVSPRRILTLVFSAKETLFKCLNPLVRRFFDFRDARVLSIDLSEHAFQVQLLATLSPTFIAGTTLSGTAAIVDDRVYTAMVLPRREGRAR